MVEDKGVKILIDPKAVLFLLGTEMDYKTDKLSAQFVFNNPNQTSACGCGESVQLTPARAPRQTRDSCQRRAAAWTRTSSAICLPLSAPVAGAPHVRRRRASMPTASCSALSMRDVIYLKADEQTRRSV